MNKVIVNLPCRRFAYQLRQVVLKMICNAQSGHLASSLDLADLFSVLYLGKILRFNPKNPTWSKRDYLLISNGHIAPLLYATLSKVGFFSGEELKTFRQINSRLQGHPHFSNNKPDQLPGIENTAGSLGQGLSQAAGLAWALRLDHKQNLVWCLMSDGEQQEGQIWEAYQFIIAKQLKNLISIIDLNQIQISGQVSEVMPLGNLKLKLLSFGFAVLEVDGHDYQQLLKILNEVKEYRSQPTILLLKTVAGRGVSFMENDYSWHGRIPNGSEFHQAMAELKIKEKIDD